MKTKNTYYVRKSGSMYELCQNHFKSNPNHPHNVCAVASSHSELISMYDLYLSGGVDTIED